MITLRGHVFQTRHGGRRGSVIVLVVAVLALLAVIGTVYVVSSRAERGNASTASTAENLENAQDAVNQIITQTISEPMYDIMGTVGGSVWQLPVQMQGFPILGQRMARRWDMPEMGIKQFIPANPANPVGSSDYNPFVRDQAWLVSDLYRPEAPNGVVQVPNGYHVYNELSLFTPGAFDAATGQFDLPYYQVLNGAPTINPRFGPLYFNAVAPANPSAFNSYTGTNPAQVARTPLAQSGDSLIQLLPFTDASGVRYRWGARIIDSSSMANLNVGSAQTNIQEIRGTYYNSYQLDNPYTYGDDPNFAPNLDGVASTSNPGRRGSWAIAPTDYQSLFWSWQWAAMRFESPGALASQGAMIRPFDLTDELELRAYGDVGLGYQLQFGNIWPITFATGNAAWPPGTVNVRRGDYTTYSYSRDIRQQQNAMNDPNLPVLQGGALPYPIQYTVSGLEAAYQPPNKLTFVWPLYPAKAGVNPDVSFYNSYINAFIADDQLAVAATNIATAMEFVNGGNVMTSPATCYTHAEACSFAANYLTYRWNSWTLDATGGYSLLRGPSFVDDQGICIRNGVQDKNYGGPAVISDLNSKDPGTTQASSKIYMGYAAQPFINEMAETISVTLAGGRSVDDSAIELYNPYNMPLSLKDYQLVVNGTVYDLSTRNYMIPARGYFVVSKKGTMAIDGSATADKTGLTSDPEGPVYLMRRYYNRNNVASWATIDQFNGAKMADAGQQPAPGSPPKTLFVARFNDEDTTNPNYVNRWMAAIHTSDCEIVHTMGGTPDLSLGKANPDKGSITSVAPLYDRVIEHLSFGDTNAQRTRLLDNFADFNRIMRISNEITTTGATTGLPMGNGPVSTQISLKSTDPHIVNSTFKADAGVHFDFLADQRAAQLLEMLTLVDRVSDYTIDLGDNDTLTAVRGMANPIPSRGISKLRIPGKINVNTASADVLRSIPYLNAHPQFVVAIMAYRWRTTSNDPRIPADLQALNTTYDFTDANPSNPTAKYPGYGIRSLSELLIPLTSGISGVLTLSDPTPDTTIQPGRDQVWASILNSVTVRSDTFVVYAYLEAVRQNPRYTGAFDNQYMWYFNRPLDITDDPSDRTHPLLRLGRKRWIAIVDRSQANYNRYVPGSINFDPRFTHGQIVATKDLPQ